MVTNDKVRILKILTELKSDLPTQYKVKELGVFGSLIRGEQTVTSDVDILVDFNEQANLFDLIGLAQFLEEKLQCKVDVVSKRALRPELREIILNEVEVI